VQGKVLKFTRTDAPPGARGLPPEAITEKKILCGCGVQFGVSKGSVRLIEMYVKVERS